MNFTPEELNEAKRTVIARLVEHGWIAEAAHTDVLGSFLFTDRGESARVVLRRFLMSNPTPAEMTVFLCFIESTSETSEHQ